MKQFLSITTLVLMAFAAYSSPIKSNDAAKGIAFSDDNAYIPTAADYIHDGLVCMFDGIENLDYGIHDGLASTWTDLISGKAVYVGSNVSFGDNYIRVGAISSRFIPTKDLINENASFTAEVVGFCPDYVSCCNIGFQDAVSFYFAWSTSIYIAQSGYSGCVAKNVGGNTVKSGVVVYDGENIAFYLPKERLYSAYAMSWRQQTSNGFLPANGSGGTCAIRLYNRALSAEEIEYNFKIDKARFGL